VEKEVIVVVDDYCSLCDC